jgi:hypothetical protein
VVTGRPLFPYHSATVSMQHWLTALNMARSLFDLPSLFNFSSFFCVLPLYSFFWSFLVEQMPLTQSPLSLFSHFICLCCDRSALSHLFVFVDLFPFFPISLLAAFFLTQPTCLDTHRSSGACLLSFLFSPLSLRLSSLLHIAFCSFFFLFWLFSPSLFLFFAAFFSHATSPLH